MGFLSKTAGQQQAAARITTKITAELHTDYNLRKPVVCTKSGVFNTSGISGDSTKTVSATPTVTDETNPQKAELPRYVSMNRLKKPYTENTEDIQYQCISP